MNRFLNGLRNGLARFMYGRNGTDQLNVALLTAYIALLLLRTLLLLLFPLEILAICSDVLVWALVIVIFFRIFSRNLEKRRRENQRFLQWWTPKRAAYAAWNSRRRDKEHRYFKCRHCGAICRVPRGKGRIEITCPKCHATRKAKS